MAGAQIEAISAAEAAASLPLRRNSSFLLLWAGQFVSQLGDRLATVALAWLVYQHTESALSTGAVLALNALPYVLFGTVAGVAIDRLNKRWVMVSADIVRGVLVLLVPYAAGRSLASVFVIAFALASVAVLFDPCKLAILPDLVGGSRLLRANSLLATGENLTEVVGYSASGLMLAAVSTATAFRIDAVTFAVSAAALLAMHYEAPVRAAAEQSARTVFAQLREGFSFLRHHRGLAINTALVVAITAGAGASYPLTFLFAVRVLDAGTSGFGLLEGALAAGYLTGSLVLATVASRVRKGRAMIAGFLVMGGCMAGVALTQATWQAMIPFVGLGIANSAAIIAVDTYVQEIVPEHLRGRVWGTRFTLTQGTYALSVLAGGALAASFDVRALFVLAGALVAVPAVASIFIPDVREA